MFEKIAEGAFNADQIYKMSCQKGFQKVKTLFGILFAIRSIAERLTSEGIRMKKLRLFQDNTRQLSAKHYSTMYRMFLMVEREDNTNSRQRPTRIYLCAGF
jgi:hypothetical protein